MGLMATIQIQLRSKGERVYALIVDFKRAFDSVKHCLLWKKLFHLGVRGKIARLINARYDDTLAQVKQYNELSEQWSSQKEYYRANP